MKKEVKVSTAAVYDARSLAELVGVANEFASNITIDMNQRCINVKSIMGVMGLGLDVGKVVVVEANGEDEAEAVVAIEQFLTK